MEERLRTLKLHFFYCTVILLMVLIAIATDRWTLQPKFTEFLSNAATMTSLVLGLVAIFYSFISNDGMSKSLGSIVTVSDEVRQTKEQISRQAQLAETTLQESTRAIDLFQAASKEVDANIATLSERLGEIRVHTEALHGSLRDLPSRLDKFESRVMDATKGIGEKAHGTTAPTDKRPIEDWVVNRLLERSALSANLLAYACVLAQKHKKLLDLAAFGQSIGNTTQSYQAGYLACMDALDLIDRSPVENTTRTYTIASVHPALAKTARDYFTSYIDRIYKTENPESYERWSTALKQLEALYES
jgi:hypothetical protein